MDKEKDNGEKEKREEGRDRLEVNFDCVRG